MPSLGASLEVFWQEFELAESSVQVCLLGDPDCKPRFLEGERVVHNLGRRGCRAALPSSLLTATVAGLASVLRRERGFCQIF